MANRMQQQQYAGAGATMSYSPMYPPMSGYMIGQQQQRVAQDPQFPGRGSSMTDSGRGMQPPPGWGRGHMGRSEEPNDVYAGVGATTHPDNRNNISGRPVNQTENHVPSGEKVTKTLSTSGYHRRSFSSGSALEVNALINFFEREGRDRPLKNVCLSILFTSPDSLFGGGFPNITIFHNGSRHERVIDKCDSLLLCLQNLSPRWSQLHPQSPSTEDDIPAAEPHPYRTEFARWPQESASGKSGGGDGKEARGRAADVQDGSSSATSKSALADNRSAPGQGIDALSAAACKYKLDMEQRSRDLLKVPKHKRLLWRIGPPPDVTDKASMQAYLQEKKAELVEVSGTQTR